jgi:hypothetical protein
MRLLCGQGVRIDNGWNATLHQDYTAPSLHITFLEAVGRRLRHNYGWIFCIQVTSYVGKLLIHPTPIGSLDEFFVRATIGPVPVLTVAVSGAPAGRQRAEPRRAPRLRRAAMRRWGLTARRGRAKRATILPIQSTVSTRLSYDEPLSFTTGEHRSYQTMSDRSSAGFRSFWPPTAFSRGRSRR